MKLHGTVVEEIMRIYDTYGGHKLLRDTIHALDLSTYRQNSTGNDVLVLTKELDTEMKSKPKSKS
jgi:hypothetical protein